jgi:hypothetical protein
MLENDGLLLKINGNYLTLQRKSTNCGSVQCLRAGRLMYASLTLPLLLINNFESDNVYESRIMDGSKHRPLKHIVITTIALPFGATYYRFYSGASEIR